MQADTFARALSYATTAVPFAMFAIQLVNGHRYVIRHPEAVELTGALVKFTEGDGTDHFFDAASVARVFYFPTPPEDP